MSDKMFAWFKCDFCTNKFETKRNMVIHKIIEKIATWENWESICE